MAKKYIELETVGTVLKEEFIEPYNLTIEQVANAISVPAWKLFAVIDGGEPMVADLDLLLTKYFGLTEGYFLRMQELYNLRLAKQKLRKKLSNIIPIFNLSKRVVAAL
ncbi:XRE family transcriptional regulator [Fibrobacteria bacterium R8-3-H12]